MSAWNFRVARSGGYDNLVIFMKHSLLLLFAPLLLAQEPAQEKVDL
jgi:hypothetical protein